MTTDRSILIVDDDADVREIIGEALETAGYRVAGASNGAEALRLLRNNTLRPDLILLDLMMPVMDGRAFRAEQQEDPELASIPVLVFTAYGDHRRIAQELRAAGSLSKPLRLDELLSTIARVPREPVGLP
jgi:CheY-like chemotaxis protein